MGPYVLRSVNAHFKLWDDGVKDSFEESIKQAPASDIPQINATCVCNITAGNCGNTTLCQQGGCCAGFREYDDECPPPSIQGCDGHKASACNPDPTCCLVYSSNGCSQTSVPPNGLPSAGQPVQAGSTGLPAGCSTYSTNICYAGQSQWTTQCPGLPTACCPDPSCAAQCTGPYSSDSTVNLFCQTNTITPPTNLDPSTNTGITFVANQAACAPNPTCQMYCVAPNVLNSTGTACVAPSTPSVQCFGNKNGTIYSFNGEYTGSFSGNIQNNSCGNIDISMSCTSNGTLGGICITADNCGTHRTGSGSQPGCAASPSSISCSGSSMTFYWQPGNGGTCANGGGCTSCQSGNNTCSPTYTINCSGGQLTNVIDNNPADPGVGGITAASTNGCNWSGSVTIRDFGTGNDMTLNCGLDANGNGILTQFTYDV